MFTSRVILQGRLKFLQRSSGNLPTAAFPSRALGVCVDRTRRLLASVQSDLKQMFPPPLLLLFHNKSYVTNTLKMLCYCLFMLSEKTSRRCVTHIKSDFSVCHAVPAPPWGPQPVEHPLVQMAPFPRLLWDCGVMLCLCLRGLCGDAFSCHCVI